MQNNQHSAEGQKYETKKSSALSRQGGYCSQFFDQDESINKFSFKIDYVLLINQYKINEKLRNKKNLVGYFRLSAELLYENYFSS